MAEEKRETKSAGPLAGIRVIELAAIGPAPFCCMLLSDMGAEIIRVDRAMSEDSGPVADSRFNVLDRGRQSVAVDLKRPEGTAVVKKLIRQADVLIEGYRPGVMEKLGLGPSDCFPENPRLVYGRMTGWGQDGPLAQAVGHDINYIAISGALHTIGPEGGAPVPPLNLLGDFGGGALYLALGIVSALYETQKSGKGQVVDAAMVDGVTSLMSLMSSHMARGIWKNQRAANRLDGGAPWYGVYETSDGKYVSVGCIEERFYKTFIQRMGLDGVILPAQHDREKWPELKNVFAEKFKSKTRDEWVALMEGSDACFAPVLDPFEARSHPHLRHRGSYIEANGMVQPAPAPRFSRTSASIKGPPVLPGQHTAEVLTRLGFAASDIESLRGSGAIKC